MKSSVIEIGVSISSALFALTVKSLASLEPIDDRGHGERVTSYVLYGIAVFCLHFLVARLDATLGRVIVSAVLYHAVSILNGLLLSKAIK